MNQDRIEGNWEQLKGKVRETWGELTADDMTKVRGQRQALRGRLQARFGLAKEAAEVERVTRSMELMKRSSIPPAKGELRGHEL